MSSRLFFMFSLYFYLLANGLTIRNTGIFHHNIYAKLRFHFRNQHIQMLLSQTSNDLLLGFHIIFISDGTVLFHQPLQGLSDFSFVPFRFWLKRNGQTRCWKLHRLTF